MKHRSQLLRSADDQEILNTLRNQKTH